MSEREPLRRDRPWVEPDMKLPEGMHCGDCRHMDRCAALYGHILEDEVCDWSPSRFSPIAGDAQ